MGASQALDRAAWATSLKVRANQASCSPKEHLLLFERKLPFCAICIASGRSICEWLLFIFVRRSHNNNKLINQEPSSLCLLFLLLAGRADCEARKAASNLTSAQVEQTRDLNA